MAFFLVGMVGILLFVVASMLLAWHFLREPEAAPAVKVPYKPTHLHREEMLLRHHDQMVLRAVEARQASDYIAADIYDTQAVELLKMANKAARGY